MGKYREVGSILVPAPEGVSPELAEFVMTYAPISECGRCGALVVDREGHDAWHENDGLVAQPTPPVFPLPEELVPPRVAKPTGVFHRPPEHPGLP